MADPLARTARMVRIAVAAAALACNVQAQTAQDVIVEFRSASPVGFRRDLAVIASLQQNKSRAAPAIRREYSVVFYGAALHVERETLPSVAALPYVKAIHPDLPVQALSTRNAPRAAIATTPLLNFSTRGDGATVAVIDTGIDYTHPALGGGFGPGFKVAGGYDFVNDDTDPRDDNGHGTHVAGIIAADSAEMIGVAPGATLVAYKVLDAFGSGRESDVIAALERAADPNGDGDVSDHLAVANLSLGGIGTPDDPQSSAVDAAVAAGVIVCVAAGNAGEVFSILSPGTARAAITVGAATADGILAPFSSRGPSVKLASIKPDVLAPGVKIRSTFPGGGFVVKDGTSMAAPYVTGACAAMHALHPEWTPQQVKSAITMTAIPIGAETMAQGAGLIDVAAALNTSLVASASHFSLGLDSEQGETWRRSQSLNVTNRASVARTYIITTTASDDAITARATPSKLELEPGASGVVTLTVTVNHRMLISAPPSYSHGGSVTLTGSGTSVHFAWAFVHASRAIMSVEQSTGSFFLLCDTASRPLWLAPNAAEVYVPAGAYQVAALAYDPGGGGLAKNAAFIDGSASIEGDRVFHFARETVQHVVMLRGTDERGVPLAAGAAAHYIGRFRILAPPLDRALEVLTADGILGTNDLHDDVLIKAAEIGVDPETNRIIALQYAALAGVTSNTTLASSAADLKHLRMRFVYARGAARRQLSIDSMAIEAAASDSFASVAVAAYDTDGAAWNGDLYANEEAADGHVITVALRAGEPGQIPDIVTSALRVREGRFIASTAMEPSALSYAAEDGEMVTYGDGPALLAPSVVAFPLSLHVSVSAIGAAGESLPRAVAGGMLTLYDGYGNVDVEREADSADTTRRGSQRAGFVTRGLCSAQSAMRATLSATFDSTRIDHAPPALTSIAVLDGNARMTSTLKRGEAGALVFTAADFDASAYGAVRGEATRAWFRASGTTEWIALTPVELAEDAALGIQYRAGLAAATLHDGATIDLRITIEDLAGNATTLTLEPAFAVAAAASGKRRSVTHP